MRYVIGFLGFSIIVLKSVWSEFNFDSTAIFLFVFSSLVILIPDIGELISRIKRFKGFGFEIELSDKLKELTNKTEKAEEKVSSEIRKEKKEQLSGLDKTDELEVDEVLEKVLLDTENPWVSLLFLTRKIEKIVKEIANKADLELDFLPISTYKVVEILSSKKIIRDDVVSILKDFWALRNQITHSSRAVFTDSQLFEFIQNGLKLLRLLKVAENNLNNSGPSLTLHG